MGVLGWEEARAYVGIGGDGGDGSLQVDLDRSEFMLGVIQRIKLWRLALVDE